MTFMSSPILSKNSDGVNLAILNLYAEHHFIHEDGC